MNCRAFHRNLEDYLDDGLDFVGRFGMEKHAGQCIQCGKDLAGAQKLRRMAQQMRKIKAPDNFEAAVFNRIGKEKARGGWFGVQKFWLYGFELPSIRKMALAGAGLAALGLGIFSVSNRTEINHVAPVAAISPVNKLIAEKPVAEKPGKLEKLEKLIVQQPIKPKRDVVPAAMIAEASKTKRTIFPEALVEKTTETSDLSDYSDQDEASVKSVPDTNYVEYQVVGPDNRPVTFRLPVKSRMRAGQTSDDNYYLRNVSH
jgi:hypothetical protein